MPSQIIWGSPGRASTGLLDRGSLDWGLLDWGLLDRDGGLVFGPARQSTLSAASATAAGAMLQLPCRSPPSSAAKQAGESNRGTHSQSTEPSRLIRAADRMSPMSA